MDNRYKSINRYNQSPARLRYIRYIHVYRAYISNYESKSFNLSQSLPPYFSPPIFLSRVCPRLSRKRNIRKRNHGCVAHSTMIKVATGRGDRTNVKFCSKRKN